MPRPPPDIQKRFAAILEAKRKRDEWARKGLKYSEAGNVKKAREALKHAERWDLERRKLKV
jgi:hypothetical protein